MDRRAFLTQTAVAASGLIWVMSSAEPASAQPVDRRSPYGPLLPPNANGLQLPKGFTSRLIALSGLPVADTGYLWHLAPDGGACMALDNGGWVYVSNSEQLDGLGGVGAIAFDAAGTVIDAYSILSGSTRSCSGGMTPWGTYLSGEETDQGRVFECDPTRPSQGIHRPLLGTFLHEMIAVDPETGTVYLVEDAPDGRLYRFEAARFGDLTEGRLFAARVTSTGRVTWRATSHTAPDRAVTTSAFHGGEGAWIMHGALYFTTKVDGRVWRLHLASQRLTVFYDSLKVPSATLTAVDNIVGHEPSGDLFVAEDGGNLEVGLLNTTGSPFSAPFLRFVGHDTSEVSGIAFNPNHTRLYVASQRGTDGIAGHVYEVAGPFRPPPHRWLNRAVRGVTQG